MPAFGQLGERMGYAIVATGVVYVLKDDAEGGSPFKLLRTIRDRLQLGASELLLGLMCPPIALNSRPLSNEHSHANERESPETDDC